MADNRLNDESSREMLSALVDGELGDRDTDTACAAWRAADSARSCWHEYQLIGDVLRSEGLAQRPSYDAAFLSRFRAELDRQPVVLAPSTARTIETPHAAGGKTSASGASHGRRWAWLAPSAVAAGVVAVAGSWVLTQQSTDQGGSSAVAQRSGAAPAVIAASPAASAVDVSALVAQGAVVRDAQLDRYLAAHKQFASTSVLGAPSGALRQVASDGAGR